jgi:succinoglycan biosynthesis protein ExoA
MSVLAIVPCLNEAANLDRLLRQMLSDDAIDLLVVTDGGSTDGSREIASGHERSNDRIRLLDNPDRIQSAGVNRAVREFGQDFTWILRIDGHCDYPDDFASMLLEAARARDSSAVAVPMVTRGRGGFQSAIAAAQNSVLGTGGSAHRHLGNGRFVDHGHHALIDRALFAAVGGYCESMPCNEDAEFDRRLTVVGGRIWLEPKAAITYYPRRGPIALWRQYFRYGVGRARTVRRHRMRMHLRQALPLLVPAALALAALMPIHWLFAAPASAWLSVCLLAGLIVGVRSGGGWAFAAGIAAAIMHLSWACGFLIEWLIRPDQTGPRYGFLATAASSSEGPKLTR